MDISYRQRVVTDLEPYQAAILDYYALQNYRSRHAVLRLMIEGFAKGDTSFDPVKFRRFVEDRIAPLLDAKENRLTYLRGQVERFVSRIASAPEGGNQC